LNRARWLILILGPLPIAGSSWAVSAWFKSAPSAAVVRNSVVATPRSDVAWAMDDRVATTGESHPALAEACEQTAARWGKDLGADCRVAVRPPFVLAGDLPQEELENWHDNSIAPAVRAMQAAYFKTAPHEPVSVLLFRGEPSYNHYCSKLFGDRDISVFGYYKPNLRTLVLNVDTGGGTLLHELTHALMDFDFPQAPDWLNEGLASLHEQCRFRTGPNGPWIEGLVNWRLEGLQEVIRQGRLRSLESLIVDPEFRGHLVGANYAQARFFCLYMQDKGVLGQVFEDCRRNRSDDPRGLKSIARAFPGLSWNQLDQDFQDWVGRFEKTP
jgi:hypothetical protein